MGHSKEDHSLPRAGAASREEEPFGVDKPTGVARANLTRSALHRCLQRHGISRLPEIEGEKP